MDGIIDIIIAVLFIAIPAIFKAIGNKLEKSGSDRAGKFKKIAEAIEDFQQSDEESSDDEKIPVEQVPVAQPEPAVPVPAPASEMVVRQVSRKPVILIEDEPNKRGEKIDPKKLVIYSEIMKPKF